MEQQWQNWWNDVMKIKNQRKKAKQKKKKLRNQWKTKSKWEGIFFQFVFQTCHTLCILNVMGKLNWQLKAAIDFGLHLID